MSHDHHREAVDWKLNGVRVIRGDQLDTNTPQTPGMNRAAAINLARVGAQKIWAGTVNIHANAKTGAHHHGALESVIYVVRGKARMRWGDKLEYVAEAAAGDFIFVPPYVPHQEINASADETLECVLVRSDNEAVVVNLEIEATEQPQAVYWVDPIHARPNPALGVFSVSGGNSAYGAARNAATIMPIPWACQRWIALWSAASALPNRRHGNRCRSLTGCTRLRAPTTRRST